MARSGNSSDISFMQMALALAARGLGQVAPNPAVGCVIVRDGVVIGRGWTQAGGRPHAETEALKRAGEAARGATAYVTLEPCAHHGKTGPCADALVEAGIARVVAANTDPDPRVAGKGFEILRKAGIEVVQDICSEQAHAINEGFFLKVLHERPLVTLKIASSADGRIATRSGESKWITGEAARLQGHLLRGTHDAIMVGSATAIVDDPQLDCRLPGFEKRSPIRIVADGRLRLPLTSKLVRSAAQSPVWLLTYADGDQSRRAAYVDCGLTLIDVGRDAGGQMDMKAALGELARRGVTRLLVEGGARLASSMVRGRLVDRIEWFRSPAIIGGDGYNAIAPFGVEKLADASVAQMQSSIRLGEDLLTRYRLRAQSE